MCQSIKPFLKWAGGKRQLVSKIDEIRISKHGNGYSRYYEPFAGGAAYFFNLKPKSAVLNDVNEEIINTYRVVKENCAGLLYELLQHEKMDEKYGSEYYYAVRGWDREHNFKLLYPDVSRAARIIYLNRKCYNGLYRVNSKGFFNVPYDASKKPFKADIENLKVISKFLNENDIRILNTDYELAVADAKADDLVYFDPPYYPMNDIAKFDKYTANGFGKNLKEKKDEQIRLKKLSDSLIERGCIVVISNSNTEFIKSLYNNEIDDAKSSIHYYIIETVTARRMINSIHSRRTSEKNNELLITNVRGE